MVLCTRHFWAFSSPVHNLPIQKHILLLCHLEPTYPSNLVDS